MPTIKQTAIEKLKRRQWTRDIGEPALLTEDAITIVTEALSKCGGKETGATPVKVKMKKGWHNAGRTGRMICRGIFGDDGMEWAAVIWDGEDDPNCFKVKALEF